MTKRNLNATTAQTTRTTKMITRAGIDNTINNNNKVIPERNKDN